MLERLLAKRHITHLDLDSVRLKLITRLGWSSDKTSDVELEYRRFLFALTRKRTEDSISPPTPDVDEFWHEHILDTRKYRGDCEKIFGRFMDHTPGLSSEQQSKADERRRRVYSEHDIDSMSFDSGDGDGGDGGGGEAGVAAHHSHSGHATECGHGTGHDGGGHDGGGSDGGGHGCGGSGDGGGGCGGGDGGGCGGGCGGS